MGEDQFALYTQSQLAKADADYKEKQRRLNAEEKMYRRQTTMPMNAFLYFAKRHGYKNIPENAKYGDPNTNYYHTLYRQYVNNGRKFNDELTPQLRAENEKYKKQFQQALLNKGYHINTKAAMGKWQEDQYYKYRANNNTLMLGRYQDPNVKNNTQQRVRQIVHRPSVSTELTNNIKSWQQRLGVAQDGIWGKNTEAAYQNYLKNNNTANTNTQPSTNQTATNPSTTTSTASTQTPATGINNNQDQSNPVPTAFNYVDSNVTQYYPQHQAGNTLVDVLKNNNQYV